MFKLKSIIVPTDFSKVSYSAIQYARDLAGIMDATIHLIHIIEINPPLLSKQEREKTAEDLMKSIEKQKQQELDDLVEEIREDSSIKVVEIIRHGTDYEEIIKYTNEINGDMIVLATHGRTGVFHKILGSVAEKVIRYSKCPVLVISPQEEEL